MGNERASHQLRDAYKGLKQVFIIGVGAMVDRSLRRMTNAGADVVAPGSAIVSQVIVVLW